MKDKNETKEAVKKILKLSKKQTRFSWWIRFQLFFKKPFCAVDFGYIMPVSCVVCIKFLRGIYYVIEIKPILSPSRNRNQSNQTKSKESNITGQRSKDL